MSGDDIDQTRHILRTWAPDQEPKYGPYIQYLSDWRDIVNRNSDGWHYWKIARNAAKKLSELATQLEEWVRSGGEAPHRLPQPPKPTLEQFRKALTPIKSFATRHQLPAPELKGVAS